MKEKKLVIPTVILTAAMIIMVLYSVCSNIAKKPTITQKEFPFSITYEIDGSADTVEGIYVARYTENGGYVSSTTRLYEGEIISQREDVDASFVLSETDTEIITLYTNFFADYLMGDAAFDYFSCEPFAPSLVYYELLENNAYTEPQDLMDRGVRLVSWDYPEPIENTFVFSHISYLTSEAVIPLAAIAAAAWLAVILFVKKEKELGKQKMDVVAVVCNFLITLICVPFFTICGIFSDINGSTPELTHQLIYLLPSITILSLAASVSLRRKGFRKIGFAAQFFGPAVFATLYLFLSISENIF